MLLSLVLHANDSEYGMEGNQLVPLVESNISIKKEVLTIKEADSGLDVLVEYTFFNPNKRKKVMVGFEAPNPDEEQYETKPLDKHPNMESFSVKLNGKKLTYKIKSVDDGYVYYFDAVFKEGINHLTHHYKYMPSGSVYVRHQIDYLLSPASRWANGIIEDFTLKIDLGDFVDFVIAKEFFESGKEWRVDGVTKETIFDAQYPEYSDDDSVPATQFYAKTSPVIFKKKNFKIEGELHLISWRNGVNHDVSIFDYRKDKLPFLLTSYLEETFPIDASSYKIFKNLPYARRGYVFNNKLVQKYYETLDWYKRNPNYKASMSDLKECETKVLSYFNGVAFDILRNLPYAKRGYVFDTYYLVSFFSTQSWYVENSKYKPSFSALSKNEQEWVKKIEALKGNKKIDFYLLMDEYKN